MSARSFLPGAARIHQLGEQVGYNAAMAGDVDRRVTTRQHGDLLDARATERASDALATTALDAVPLLTIADAARATNRSTLAIRRLAQRGALPGARKVRRAGRDVWLIPASELEVLPDKALRGESRAPTVEDLAERVAVLEALLAEIMTRVVPYWVEALGKAAETRRLPPPGSRRGLEGSEPTKTQGEN